MARQLTFVIMSATRTAADFEVLAQQAARLNSRGRVEIGVSSLAERTLADIPPGGSPWHDYTTCLPALGKFFPHRDLQPFVDGEHVKRNQTLLREKLSICRTHKLAAAAPLLLVPILSSGGTLPVMALICGSLVAGILLVAVSAPGRSRLSVT